jgi:hypothetical protein
MGPVLPFDTGDARGGAGQLPQDFAKFFSSSCHVTLCSAGGHRIGSQMTEVSRLLARLRQAKEFSENVRSFASYVNGLSLFVSCLASATVTFKLTLRPRAQCHLRDSTWLSGTGAVGSLDRHPLQNSHHVTDQVGRVAVFRKITCMPTPKRVFTTSQHTVICC